MGPDSISYVLIEGGKMALEVKLTKERDKVYTVSIVGSLDTNTYRILENEVEPILQDKAKVLVFNMEDVTYVSSMGISVILRSKRTVEDNSGTFIMMNLQPKVKKVFDIIKALPVHNIFTGREELDRYLARMQQQDSES